MTFYFIYDHDSNINIYKMKWRVEAIIKMTLVTASLNKDNYRGKQETHKPYEKYIYIFGRERKKRSPYCEKPFELVWRICG